MKYVCSLIVVEDIKRSREFYEKLLQQKVKFDFGENVVFEGDFAIHLKEHFEKITQSSRRAGARTLFGSNNFELYFETERIEEIYHRLRGEKIEFLHEIEEQPWGQRVFRFYDPDQHIVEIGEAMESIVIRFYNQGYSLEEIVSKSAMPKDFVDKVIKNNKEALS